jgi:uncharacterized SAM-binding protein YcdF (DUF218 family)
MSSASAWLPWLLPSPAHLLALLLVLLVARWWRTRRTPEQRSAFATAGLLAMTLWAWVGATPALADLALRQLEGPMPAGHREALPDAPRDERTLILVLGSGEMHAPNGRPEVRLNMHAVERLQQGVALWRRTGGRLVLTGGPGSASPDSPVSPEVSIALAMAAIAADLGVPESALVLVSNSRNTAEDLRGAADKLGAQWSEPARPRWLVTSALHMPRSLATARQLGMNVTPLRADYRQIRNLTTASWWPDPKAARRWLPVVHEVVGLLAYRWRGWA